jgi:GNAT superfamily N-acetyltransferase
MFRYEAYDADNKKQLVLISCLMKKNKFYTHDLPTIMKDRKLYGGFIMYDDEVAIGFILYLNETKLPYILITFMLIDEKYRNKGCGTSLYNCVEEQFKKGEDYLLVVEYCKYDGCNFWKKCNYAKKNKQLKNTSDDNKSIMAIHNNLEKQGVVGCMSFLYKVV